MAETNERALAAPYAVRLLGAPQLDAGQTAACELRFRMALEFSLGGTDMVLPSLQAWQLAMNLTEGLPLESAGDAEREVVALWESAEADALIAAFRPLDQDLGEAHFEISKGQTAKWPEIGSQADG